MLPLTLKDVAEASGGRLERGDPDAVAGGVAIDSRAVRPGDLFVALAGSRTDGHAHVDDALARGAAAALVSRDPGLGPAVLVDDTMRALGRLAAAVRVRLRATVVAITGSSGKTCTKDFTAAALAPTFRVTASEGSYNNEIGVPLTVLAAAEETDVVVAEVGSRGRGHIASLVPVLRPDVAVVTNVGPAHVGLFGSLEAVAEAKGELVEAIGPDGAAVLNADDERVAAMRARARCAVVTFGTAPAADVRAAEVTLDDAARAAFTVEAGGRRAAVSLDVPGEHMVSNALAAMAVATRLGVPLDAAARTVGGARGPSWRMEVADAPGGWRVVNDAYNANPASVEAALKALVRMGRGRRTWAVLGPMAELGAATEEEHDRVGRLAVRLGVGRLVTVGEDARAAHEAARNEGMAAEEALIVAGVEEAARLLLAALRPGDVVLVKASRAAGLERLAHALLEGVA